MDLSRSASNIPAPLKTLISRVLRGKRDVFVERSPQVSTDFRGPVVQQKHKTQTCLSFSKQQELLVEYTSGVPVRELAERYGVHRTTITEIGTRAGVRMRNQRLSLSANRTR